MDLKPKQWIQIERPGWFGEATGSIIQSYDEKYGKGNWRIRHRLGNRLLDFKEAVALYELCYELHFLNPNTRYLWEELFKMASEVWTEEIIDVESGMDYNIQKTKAPHYEDVAIRIIMKKYDKIFKGDRLIRVRADSEDTVGVALSSICIPFIFPEFIEPQFHEVFWWNRHKTSLENFWHTNKILQVKRDSIKK